VVAAAGLADLVAFVVAADDVAAGKPDPEGYQRALERLGGPPPHEVVAVEDTEAGVLAAKAAGLHVVAVTGTLAPERLARADALAERLEPALIARLA
jgi:sugar-phosphatase